MGIEFRVQNGAVAIWTDESDAAPFAAPVANISRVKFHSGLDYIQIINTKSFTLELPAISGVLQRTASYTLGAHGVDGTPLIFAVVNTGGHPVAFTGSVPIHNIPPPGGGGVSDFYARWLAIGANATNIVVHEYAVQGGIAGQPASMTDRPAQTVPITVYITDVLLA